MNTDPIRESIILKGACITESIFNSYINFLSSVSVSETKCIVKIIMFELLPLLVCIRMLSVSSVNGFSGL